MKPQINVGNVGTTVDNNLLGNISGKTIKPTLPKETSNGKVPESKVNKIDPKINIDTTKEEGNIKKFINRDKESPKIIQPVTVDIKPGKVDVGNVGTTVGDVEKKVNKDILLHPSVKIDDNESTVEKDLNNIRNGDLI